MDVQRKGVALRRRIRYAASGTFMLAVLGSLGFYVANLEPAAPRVDRATVWIDAVQRGPMVREVKGLGSLVPEEIAWIPATSSGQITKVYVQSGEAVHPDTILLTLSNPDMDLEATDLEWQIKQAEANLANLEVQLLNEQFDQKAAVVRAETALKQAELTKDKEEELYKSELAPELTVRQARMDYELALSEYETQQQKAEIKQRAVEAQLEAQQVQIEKLRATWKRKLQQVEELTVRAGTEGVLQEMTLQVGQRIATGDVIAKVAQPWRLKAELRIAETQAKDILLGQKAAIDTRNGVIPAHVVRIDPNVVDGTRTVDCQLDGPLPSGAVPDLTVDGTIEIERLDDVLYVSRPVFGQPDSQISLFKVNPETDIAERIPVRLGRGSVTTIEVLEGLNLGDQVILSDMSAQDAYDRIQLN